jgi:hypothetical protein
MNGNALSPKINAASRASWKMTLPGGLVCEVLH